MDLKWIKKDLNLIDLLRGGAIALFFKILGVFAGYLFFWLLANYYKAEGVGLFQTVWTVLMITGVIAKLGFDTSIVKFVSIYQAKGLDGFIRRLFRHIQKWLFLSSFILSATLVLFSSSLSFLFFETTEKENLIMFAALSLIPLVLLNFNAETLKSLKQIVAFSFFQNGTIYLVTGLLMVLFYHLNFGFNSTLWALVIALFLLLFLSYLVVYKKVPRVSSKKIKPIYTTRQLFSITFPMLFSNSLFLLMNWTDTVMLSAFLPEKEVGIYATAIKIAALNSIILVAVNSIAMPKFAEIFEQNKSEEFKKFVKQSTLFMFLVSLPILVLIFIIPEWLLGIFGSEFIVGKPVLLVLAFGQFFSTISGSVINILNMSNYQTQARNILGFSTLVNIILNLILIPLGGILGAAIATMLSTVLWNILSVIIIYRKFGFVTYPSVNFWKWKKQ